MTYDDPSRNGSPFPSSRKRHPLYLTRPSRVVVMVGQRVVHVGHVEIVSICNGPGVFTAFFDEGVHLTDADSTATDMGLAQ